MKTQQYSVKLVEKGTVVLSSIFETESEQSAAASAAATWRVPTHKLGTQLYFRVQKLHMNIYSLGVTK